MTEQVPEQEHAAHEDEGPVESLIGVETLEPDVEIDYSTFMEDPAS